MIQLIHFMGVVIRRTREQAANGRGDFDWNDSKIVGNDSAVTTTDTSVACVVAEMRGQDVHQVGAPHPVGARSVLCGGLSMAFLLSRFINRKRGTAGHRACGVERGADCFEQCLAELDCANG
ncbi:hypothetical protein [Pseudomonas bohemica]|uniref:hypothetical protein n=1 Tax=Pseudomonas bohemica TaxID=2044872 RepID=UPI0018FEDC76|nr:hypothetical protein [Pseudomonas bohemica]